MGTTTSPIFNGTSTYSQDFQNVISRATAIASLPITQLNADKTALSDQTTALTGLDGKFQTLQSAVQSISDALSGSAFQADVSDDTKLGVTLSDGAMEGNYAVDVVDPGAYATSMTATNWIAGTGPVRNYQLSLGGVSYALSPSDNSAAAVVAAINSQYGDKVRATMVNVGSGTQTDYRISLQATTLGDLQPGLLTGPSNPEPLQTLQTRGSDAVAASQTAQTWNADPSLTFQLSLNGQTHSLSPQPADNSAQSVADAINSQFGSEVTASVVDLDPDGAHDYRISLVASGAGNVQPDILASDGINPPVGLQQQTAAGSDAKAVSRTTSSWVTDTGAPLTYQLSVGGVQYSFSPADNTAASVVSAINTRYGDKVQAAVVDLGTDTAHDYRISLTAVQAGDLQPNLAVSQSNLVTQKTTGALASYIVNNSGQTVTSATRSITIATGVDVDLKAADNGTPVNITVIRPTSALSTALQAFTDAYNGAVDELDKQHGQTSAALSGQSLVNDLSRALSGLSTYSSIGGIGSLADLGLDLDKTGHITFNSFTLMGADISSSSAVTAFLGSTTSGFLKAATDAMNGIEDPASGLLPGAEAAVTAQSTSIDNTIADTQARVDQMTQNLQDQMSAADALVASMQQQYTYMSSLFQAMQTSAQQYK